MILAHPAMLRDAERRMDKAYEDYMFEREGLEAWEEEMADATHDLPRWVNARNQRDEQKVRVRRSRSLWRQLQREYDTLLLKEAGEWTPEAQQAIWS